VRLGGTSETCSFIMRDGLVVVSSRGKIDDAEAHRGSYTFRDRLGTPFRRIN
jgi:hypothetical protein